MIFRHLLKLKKKKKKEEKEAYGTTVNDRIIKDIRT